MARTVLEAQAIISATDKTGAVFSSIAQKVKGLENAMRSASGAGAKIGAAAPSIVKLDKAIKGMAGAAAGGMAAHKVANIAHAVTETYGHFDDLARYQRAILGMTQQEQKPFIEQAIKMGGSSRYNDLQVLEAQLDLAQRGVNKDFIRPIIEVAKDYGQAMNADLPEAAKTIEGILFSTRKHIEDGNEALKAAQRAVDFSVKLAKIGGLDNEDVRQFFKFAGMPGSTAGLSDESVGAMAALMRRQNIRGDEAGVAVRAIAGKLVSPTRGGMDALSAMGINYNDFVRQKDSFGQDKFNKFMASRFGLDKGAGMTRRSRALLSDTDVIADRDAFVSAGIKAFGGLFVGKKGKLSVRDRSALTKGLGDFWKLSADSVDSEGLLRAIIGTHPTLAQANKLFGEKQGARALAAMRPEFFEYYDKLKAAPEGFAKKIGDERMGGFAGAQKRLEGSKFNAETALGRAWDAELTAAYGAAAKLLQTFAEADTSTQRLVSGIVGTTTALIAFEAALKIGGAMGLVPKGWAGVVTGGLLGGARLAAGLTPWALAGGAAYLAYQGYYETPHAGGFLDDKEVNDRARTRASLAWRERGATDPDELEAIRRMQEANEARMSMATGARFGTAQDVRAVLEGSANISNIVTIHAAEGFWAEVRSMISNEIKGIRINGAPSTGTAGSTGVAMPETGGGP